MIVLGERSDQRHEPASHWRPELANTVMLKGNAEPRLCIYTIDLFVQREKSSSGVGRKLCVITCTKQKPTCISHWVSPFHHGFKQPQRAAAG